MIGQARVLVVLTPALGRPALLADSAVLARTVACSGGECYGTRRADVITGTAGVDYIFAKGGKDQVFAGTGNDTVNYGGGDDLTGGPEFNALMGRGVTDALDDSAQGGVEDCAFGGRGHDTIDVADGDHLDLVGTGGQAGDDVSADPGDAVDPPDSRCP